MGIMFSRNMYNSIASNKIISHEEQGMVVSQSHNNRIYNISVSDSAVELIWIKNHTTM